MNGIAQRFVVPFVSIIPLVGGLLGCGSKDRGTIESVAVVRSEAGFIVSWTVAGEVDGVTISEGTSPGEIVNQAAETSGSGPVTITGLDPQQRHYFRVKAGEGDGIVAAEISVPQVGILNFRDIGGYPTAPDASGRVQRVRWGRFFRSGAPASSSHQDFLATLGVKTVIDVRSPAEFSAAAPEWTGTQLQLIRTPVFDQSVGSLPDFVTPRLCLPQNVSPADPEHHYFPFDPVCFADQEAFFGPNGEFFTQFKTAVFRSFVSGNGPPGANFGDTFHEALRTLLLSLTDSGNVPLVWADSAGAARAGWGAAVVEMALGIPEEQVLADYLLTNQFRQDVNNAQLDALVSSGRLAKRVYLEPQLLERAEYLRSALDEMLRLHGSFENYAQQVLGITPEQLARIREHMLER